MKKKSLKYTRGLLALISGLILMISCHPEFEPELVTYPEMSVNEFGPQSGYPGSVVTITGSNFGRYAQAAEVSFNGILATAFLSYGDSAMEVIVPPSAQSGKLSVKVWTRNEEIGSYNVIPLPVIQSVASDSEFGSNIAFPGDIINITGSGFGTDASRLAITVGGVAATIIPPVQDDLIRIQAPEEFPTGNVELTIGGVTVVGEPPMINPSAGGDITPYFLGNTGDPVTGGNFVTNGDALVDNRWGTMGAPWVTNSAIKNKGSGVAGGWAREPWTAPPGYICFESWGNTPILDGKLYQQTALELPAGNYTLSVRYYSEVTTNSTVHIVAATGDGIPSLADLDTSLGYVEGWNDTPIDATSPSIDETKELNFTLDTAQKVSIGFLVNMQGAAERAGYFKVLWIKLVKD